ncbi:ly6/PLAUR domain-containing protein 1-like isoform 2-T5 [Menidia menidia]
MRQLTFSSFVLSFFSSGLALQIQCYQCEEMMHDCSTPEFIVNCTVNVQDMCQKEVLVKDDGWLAAAPPRGEEPVEVAWASDQDASWSPPW